MAELDTEEDDVETCRMANEAAFEKGLTFCDTPEARVRVLSRFFGIDPDPEDILSLDPDDEDALVRERVLARTEEIIAGGEDQPLDAIDQAWEDVDAEPGPDHDPEGDEDEGEEESGAEDEPDDDAEEDEDFAPLDDIDADGDEDDG